MQMQKIEPFLRALLRYEKVILVPRRQRQQRRELSSEELTPIIDLLIWHMRGYRGDRKSFFAGLPRSKTKPLNPPKSGIARKRYLKILALPPCIGKGKQRRPNPALSNLSDRDWNLRLIGKWRRGRPKETSRRDGFLLGVQQVLRTPNPWRAGDRLKGKPFLPADCYGFVRAGPLLKKIFLHISQGERFPSNMRMVKDRRIKELQRQGLRGTASGLLDDTRRNRRLMRRLMSNSISVA
jgi:hypothetical protein